MVLDLERMRNPVECVLQLALGLVRDDRRENNEKGWHDQGCSEESAGAGGEDSFRHTDGKGVETEFNPYLQRSAPMRARFYCPVHLGLYGRPSAAYRPSVGGD